MSLVCTSLLRIHLWSLPTTSLLRIPTTSCLLHFPEDVVVSLPTSSLLCESPHVHVLVFYISLKSLWSLPTSLLWIPHVHVLVFCISLKILWWACQHHLCSVNPHMFLCSFAYSLVKIFLLLLLLLFKMFNSLKSSLFFSCKQEFCRSFIWLLILPWNKSISAYGLWLSVSVQTIISVTKLQQNTACSAHTIQAHGVVSWMVFL